MTALLWGCIPHYKKINRPESVGDKPIGSVSTGPGFGDTYSIDEKRTKRWTIHWKGLGVNLTTGGASSGLMKGVLAQTYEGSQAGSTVTADFAQGDKLNRELVLYGHAVVLSQDKKSLMKCDRLRYIAPEERYIASGNVRFVNPVGSIGPLPELIANSKLTKVATPGDFNR